MSEYPLETIRHSAAHVMAAAVKQLYPDAKFDIGPATENGFYYASLFMPRSYHLYPSLGFSVFGSKLPMPPV